MLATLTDNYFKDAASDEQNHTLFAFAAYGMGAGAVQSMRNKAAAQQLNPNIWFNNVERVAAAAPSGQETVRAVRNIYKYYVAYKLIEDAEAAKKAAVDSAKPERAELPPSAQPSN